MKDRSKKIVESAPIVSICCLTYNHESFIHEAVNGFLMQKTNFPFDIIIHDDASTDRTAEIIREYEANYPTIIKGIYQKENQYSKGARGMFVRYVFPHAKGKYIALCEGDDYWTDPFKLQKQVDFLEANEDYAICFHNVYELADSEESQLLNLDATLEGETFTIKDLAKGNFIHTPSVVFRNGLIKRFPVWFKDSPVGDYPLYMLLAQHGKIGRLPQVMATYRMNVGVWSKHSFTYRATKWLLVLEYLIDYFDQPEILDILVSQQLEILKGLTNVPEQLQADKKYLLYHKLIKTLSEKEDELQRLKSFISASAKNNSSKGLINALVKRAASTVKWAKTFL